MPQDTPEHSEIQSLLPFVRAVAEARRAMRSKAVFRASFAPGRGNMTKLAERSGLERTHLVPQAENNWTSSSASGHD